MDERLLQAKGLCDKEPDEALRLCNEVMNEEMTGVNAEMALFMAAYIMMNAKRFGLAYQMYKRCAEAAPHVSETWSNMGMCLEEHDSDEAMRCFKQAEKLDPQNFRALANQALIYLQAGEPEKCIKYCDRALRINECKALLRLNLKMNQFEALERRLLPAPGLGITAQSANINGSPYCLSKTRLNPDMILSAFFRTC